MEEIKEIVKIVSKNKIKKIDILVLGQAKTKLHRLYNLIQTGAIQSDEEAIAKLYPTDSTKSRNSYFKLKHSLRKRMMNTIFFISSSSIAGEYKTAYFEASKNVTEIKLLLAMGARQTGLRMAKRLFPKIENNEFWDIALDLAILIRPLYVFQIPSKKMFLLYDRKIQIIQQTNEVLLFTETLYYRLLTEIINNKISNLEIHHLAAKYEKMLVTRVAPLPSERIKFYKNAITAIKLMKIYEYQKTIDVLTHAKAKIKKPEFYKKYIATYLGNLIACNIYLKQYQEGRNNLETAKKFVKKGTLNWFQLNTTHLMLAFHSKNYSHVLPIYQEVVGHKNFVKVPQVFREIWILNFAWIYLLWKIDKVKLPPNFLKKNFTLDELLGQIQEATKDKKGLNINIKIIQTIGWLIDENYDALFDKEDSLKRYRYRYVKNSAQKRANLILRYLINVNKRDYIEHKCIKITETAKKDFAEKPVELKWENFEIEIIPFDDVVDYIFEVIKKNRRRV